MTERETWRWRFAGQALQGRLSDNRIEGNEDTVASDAVAFGSALLAELERTVPATVAKSATVPCDDAVRLAEKVVLPLCGCALCTAAKEILSKRKDGAKL